MKTYSEVKDFCASFNFINNLVDNIYKRLKRFVNVTNYQLDCIDPINNGDAIIIFLVIYIDDKAIEYKFNINIKYFDDDNKEDSPYYLDFDRYQIFLDNIVKGIFEEIFKQITDENSNKNT